MFPCSTTIAFRDHVLPKMPEDFRLTQSPKPELTGSRK